MAKWRSAARLLSVLGVPLAAALLAATGSAGAAAMGPIRPLTGPGGQVQRTLRNQVESSNWSGYAVAEYETGLRYSAATATWMVPAVTLPSGESSAYSSTWVGIGGFCENASCTSVDRTLIQLGTEQDATASGTSYYAWYETLPKPPVTIRGFAVRPGDVIVASLADGAAGHRKPDPKGGGGTAKQTWTLTLTDETTGASWSKTLSYDSSLASAEWIMEAPLAASGVLPLADYGTVTFDPGTADGQNPALAPADAVVMVNPNGQTSNPSQPDSDTDGFNACFGEGTTLTACSPPAS